MLILAVEGLAPLPLLPPIPPPAICSADGLGLGKGPGVFTLGLDGATFACVFFLKFKSLDARV